MQGVSFITIHHGNVPTCDVWGMPSSIILNRLQEEKTLNCIQSIQSPRVMIPTGAIIFISMYAVYGYLGFRHINSSTIVVCSVKDSQTSRENNAGIMGQLLRSTLIFILGWFCLLCRNRCFLVVPVPPVWTGRMAGEWGRCASVAEPRHGIAVHSGTSCR